MAGTWQGLVHPPTFDASTMVLLTDGALMCQESGGVRWWRLTPNAHGSYVAATWTALAPMRHARLFFPSLVLPDGRVFVAGGRYGGADGDVNSAEIYDPVLDRWTDLSAPPGWRAIDDAACGLLADGRVLLRAMSNERAAIFDPNTNSWSAAASGDETPGFVGGTSLLIPNQPGASPGLPPVAGHALVAADAPRCVMPNGRMLYAAATDDAVGSDCQPQTSFFEFDGAAVRRVPVPSNGNAVPSAGRMLLVPTGQVLFASGTADLQVYTPDGAPDSARRPHITAGPPAVRPLQTYTLHLKQLNGPPPLISGHAAFAPNAHPLVRIRHLVTGHVTYCRTFDHSTAAVAADSTIGSTQLAVPATLPHGPSEMTVVINGIESPPHPVIVRNFSWPFAIEQALVNRLIASVADEALWALGPNGPVAVERSGPEVAEEAERARDRVIHGVRTLQEIGHAVSARRAIAAAAVPRPSFPTPR